MFKCQAPFSPYLYLQVKVSGPCLLISEQALYVLYFLAQTTNTQWPAASTCGYAAIQTYLHDICRLVKVSEDAALQLQQRVRRYKLINYHLYIDNMLSIHAGQHGP